MNNEDIKGYLKKKKSSAFKRLISNTNLRWFELRFRNEIFCYKKSRSDEQYEKKFSFSSIINVTTELSDNDTKFSSWKFGFKIVFKEHEMVLYSETERERMMWINGFRDMFRMRNPVKETVNKKPIVKEEIKKEKEVVIKRKEEERKEEEEGDEEEEDEDEEGEDEEEEENSEEDNEKSDKDEDNNSEDSNIKEKEDEYEKRIKEEEKKEKEKKLQAISKALKIDKIKDESHQSSEGNSTKKNEHNENSLIIEADNPKPPIIDKETSQKEQQQIKFSDDSQRPIINLIKTETVQQSSKEIQSNEIKSKSNTSSKPSKKKQLKESHKSLQSESPKNSIQSKPIVKEAKIEETKLQPSIKEKQSKQSTIKSKKSKQSSIKENKVEIKKEIMKPIPKESKEIIKKESKITIRSKSQNVFPSTIDNHSIHSIYTPEQDSIIQSAISDIIENNDLFTNHFESSIFTTDSIIHNSSNNSSMINCNDNDLDDWNFYDDDKKLIAENDLINFNPLSNRPETRKIIKAKKKISNKDNICDFNKNNIKSFKEPIYISTANTEREDKKQIKNVHPNLKEAKNTSFEFITQKPYHKTFSTNNKKYKNSIARELENAKKYTNMDGTSIKKVDIYAMNKKKKEEPNVDNFIYKKHVIGVSNKIEDDLYSFGSKNTNNLF